MLLEEQSIAASKQDSWRHVLKIGPQGLEMRPQIVLYGVIHWRTSKSALVNRPPHSVGGRPPIESPTMPAIGLPSVFPECPFRFQRSNPAHLSPAAHWRGCQTGTGGSAELVKRQRTGFGYSRRGVPAFTANPRQSSRTVPARLQGPQRLTSRWFQELANSRSPPTRHPSTKRYPGSLCPAWSVHRR